MNYYIPDNKDDNMIYLKDIVFSVSNLCKKEEFWQTVFDACTNISDDSSRLNKFGKFVEKLKNKFISNLQGKSKELCCRINAIIQSIKEQSETEF